MPSDRLPALRPDATRETPSTARVQLEADTALSSSETTEPTPNNEHLESIKALVDVIEPLIARLKGFLREQDTVNSPFASRLIRSGN